MQRRKREERRSPKRRTQTTENHKAIRPQGAASRRKGIHGKRRGQPQSHKSLKETHNTPQTKQTIHRYGPTLSRQKPERATKRHKEPQSATNNQNRMYPWRKRPTRRHSRATKVRKWQSHVEEAHESVAWTTCST